jgi:hypothetical protein
MRGGRGLERAEAWLTSWGMREMREKAEAYKASGENDSLHCKC